MRTVLTLILMGFSTICLAQDVENFGYVPNPDATQAFCATISQTSETSAENLVRADNGKDVLLYRYVVECVRKNPTLAARWLDSSGRLRAYNQGSVGSCTGHGTAHALNCRFALQCVQKNSLESFAMVAAADGLYGLGREHANMLGSRGDGCYGSALAEAITESGTLYRIKYDDYDLTEYDENRCKKFGYSGVGDALKASADDHLVTEVVNVKTAERAWALIGNGYPINVCSQQGFTTQRNAEGICEAKGTWAHSMAIIGRRTTGKGEKLFLIQNSWGDSSPSGPYWQDQPHGSFFARYDVVNKMLSCGDSFAYGDIKDFEIKNDNWGTEEFL